MAAANYPICSVKGCSEGPRGSAIRHHACPEHVNPDECEFCEMIKHTCVTRELENDEQKILCFRCFNKYNKPAVNQRFIPCVYRQCLRRAYDVDNLCEKHTRANRCTNCHHATMTLDDYPESGGRLICRHCARIKYDKYFRNNRPAPPSDKLQAIKNRSLEDRRKRQIDDQNKQLAIGRGEDPNDPDHKNSDSDSDDEDGNEPNDEDGDAPDEQDNPNEPDNPGNDNKYAYQGDGKDAKEDRSRSQNESLLDRFNEGDLSEVSKGYFDFGSDDDEPKFMPNNRTNIKKNATSLDSVASRIRQRQRDNINNRKKARGDQLKKGRTIDISEESD